MDLAKHIDFGKPILESALGPYLDTLKVLCSFDLWHH